MNCKYCTTGGCHVCGTLPAPNVIVTPVTIHLDPLWVTDKTCRQCNGTKRVMVAPAYPNSVPVKVVCGECAED